MRADVGAAVDHVLEVEAVRPRDVQHEIAHGVRLIVGASPHVVLVQRLEAGTNLSRVLFHEPRPRDPQKLVAEGSIHEAE
jgi:hypothetical protein